MVERLFLAVPRGCLRLVIVVFPDHAYLLFLQNTHFIKLAFVIKIFVLSIFEWPFYKGFTVYVGHIHLVLYFCYSFPC